MVYFVILTLRCGSVAAKRGREIVLDAGNRREAGTLRILVVRVGNRIEGYGG